MIIYLDSDYVCHIVNDGTMQAVETNEFDGKENAYIEGYRYVPEGQTWIRSDGVEFHGLMIAPAMDYNKIMTNVAISYLDDDQAESVSVLFPLWAIGVDYAVDDRRRDEFDGLLYRCIQAHKSQSDWQPHLVPALWVRTYVDPFPEWIQPTGVHDAYRINATVSHNGKHWISIIDYNTYEPSVFGWDEVVD